MNKKNNNNDELRDIDRSILRTLSYLKNEIEFIKDAIIVKNNTTEQDSLSKQRIKNAINSSFRHGYQEVDIGTIMFHIKHFLSESYANIDFNEKEELNNVIECLKELGYNVYESDKSHIISRIASKDKYEMSLSRQKYKLHYYDE
jgi:hypothetical protein